MARALTTKQQAFVESYLTCWNASQAARDAGYRGRRANQQGQDYLSKPDIQAAIQARLAELKMGADEVLTRLTDQARGSIADFIDLTPADAASGDDMDAAKAIVSGWRLNLGKAQRAGQLHLIKKLKSGQWGPEIELYSAQTALEDLAKAHGLFVDRTEITGKDGAAVAIRQFTNALDTAYAPDDDNPATKTE